METNNLKYFIALNMIDTSNAQVLHSLLKKFKNPEKLFDSEAKKSANLKPVEKNFLSKILSRSDYYLKIAEKELEAIEKDTKLDVIPITDKRYPSLLKKIYDPPLLLYVKGDIDALNYPMISIVGSRFSTRYGCEIAFNFASQLSELGITIVSGMAVGIDEFAHKGALFSKGKTVAVLGSGLYYIYPPENKKLYSDIVESGLVVSEFPLTSKPEKYNFPRRNRIISGLSLGTIVVEARMRSGALITSSFAAEQNREVFAVPGPINSETSKGTNSLIKNGAKLVQKIEDVLDELNIDLKTIKQEKLEKKEEDGLDDLTDEEKFLLKFVGDEPKNVEEIIKSSKLEAKAVESLLMMLEIKGLIMQIPGHRFRLISNE